MSIPLYKADEFANARCQGQYDIVGPSKIPQHDGFKCNTCLQPSPPFPCQCCFHANVNGVETTWAYSQHQNQPDGVLSPGCVWVHVPSSDLLPFPDQRAIHHAISWDGGSLRITADDGLGNLFAYAALRVGSPCIAEGQTITLTWSNNGIPITTPAPTFYFSDVADDEFTIILTQVKCADCATGLCNYTNFWDGEYHGTLRLAYNGCYRFCDEGNFCNCPPVDDDLYNTYTAIPPFNEIWPPLGVNPSDFFGIQASCECVSSSSSSSSSSSGGCEGECDFISSSGSGGFFWQLVSSTCGEGCAGCADPPTLPTGNDQTIASACI